eukprot:Pgem_evm2s5498
MTSKQVKIGHDSGKNGMGSFAVAIGSEAGLNNQHANTICINASGSSLNSATGPACYIDPIRDNSSSSFTGMENNRTLMYNNNDKEVIYNTLPHQHVYALWINDSFTDTTGFVSSKRVELSDPPYESSGGTFTVQSNNRVKVPYKGLWQIKAKFVLDRACKQDENYTLSMNYDNWKEWGTNGSDINKKTYGGVLAPKSESVLRIQANPVSSSTTGTMYLSGSTIMAINDITTAYIYVSIGGFTNPLSQSFGFDKTKSSVEITLISPFY